MTQQNKPYLFDATIHENPISLSTFIPPADFDHGPEFADEPPRALPPHVRRSRYVRTRKATVWILLMIGSACWATDQVPFVKMLSWYLLPLGYLNWIGAIFLGLAIIYWIRNLISPGYLKCVRLSIPLIGRVRHVWVNPLGSAQYPHGRFTAEVEFRHPETGDMHSSVVGAPDAFMMSQLPTLDSGVQPGDYVTLVYLPGRLENSLEIYGWLGLNPDIDFIRKNGFPLKPMSPMTALMIVLGITAIAWLLFGFFYVIGRYSPLDEDHWQPYAVGLALVVVPLFVVFLRFVKRDGVTNYTLWKRYALALLSAVFFGFIASFVAVGFLNGFFDRSPTHLEPVEIVQQWHETTEFVIRTYQLEFHPYPKGPTSKKMVTVETMSAFQPDSLGVIDVGRGWLGMQWIREFYPIVWQPAPNRDQPISPGEVVFQMPNQPQFVRIIPQIIAGDSGVFSPPEVLVPELRRRMVFHLTNNLRATVIEPVKR